MSLPGPSILSSCNIFAFLKMYNTDYPYYASQSNQHIPTFIISKVFLWVLNGIFFPRLRPHYKFL